MIKVGDCVKISGNAIDGTCLDGWVGDVLDMAMVSDHTRVRVKASGQAFVVKLSQLTPHARPEPCPTCGGSGIKP